MPFFGVPAAAGAAFLAGSTMGLPAGRRGGRRDRRWSSSSLERIVARRLLAARRPSQTLTVLLIVALVDAYGFIGLLFASTLAMSDRVVPRAAAA